MTDLTEEKTPLITSGDHESKSSSSKHSDAIEILQPATRSGVVGPYSQYAEIDGGDKNSFGNQVRSVLAWKWITLVLCLLIPTAAGLLNGFFSRTDVYTNGYLILPDWAVPSWVYPVAWTILYLLMGLSLFLVIIEEKVELRYKIVPFALFVTQFAFNLAWPNIFFGNGDELLGLLIIGILLGLVFGSALVFGQVSFVAGLLWLPYLGWSVYATLLNYYIILLNKHKI